MKKLNLNKPIYCEVKKRNNGNPFEVLVIRREGKYAVVKTTGGYNVIFKTLTENLFNID